MVFSWTTEEQASRIEQIRQMTIHLFHERGYPATSIRDIARHLDIKSSSLYYHFHSKQDLLFDVLNRIMDELIRGLEAHVARGQSPQEKLVAAVRFHISFHMEHRAEAFISHSELRFLSPENFRRIVEKRKRYEEIFQEVLREGVEAGVLEIPDVKVVSYAILLMCTGVSSWFSEKGRLRGEEVARIHEELILRGILKTPKGGESEAGEEGSLRRAASFKR